MKIFTSVTNPEIARILNAGGIGVLRTDTLYGLVGRADDHAAVQRIYDLKHRDEAKSPIVLIAANNQPFDDIPDVAVHLLENAWPGPVSVILPSTNAPEWIRRDNQSVAYRLPDDDDLRMLLQTTGPLIAPSANPEDEPPAMDVHEAKSYFGNQVDFYVDGGQVSNAKPSRLLRVNADGTTERLR